MCNCFFQWTLLGSINKDREKMIYRAVRKAERLQISA